MPPGTVSGASSLCRSRHYFSCLSVVTDSRRRRYSDPVVDILARAHQAAQLNDVLERLDLISESFRPGSLKMAPLTLVVMWLSSTYSPLPPYVRLDSSQWRQSQPPRTTVLGTTRGTEVLDLRIAVNLSARKTGQLSRIISRGFCRAFATRNSHAHVALSLAIDRRTPFIDLPKRRSERPSQLRELQ